MDSVGTSFFTSAIGGLALVYSVYLLLQAAYTIRLRAILDYGPVIHEFDPYFNYRATEVCRSALYHRFNLSWVDLNEYLTAFFTSTYIGMDQNAFSNGLTTKFGIH